MSVEIQRLLVLSTAHVSDKTAAILGDDPSGWPVSGGPYSSGYGWFMYAHDEDSEGNIPVELMNVFRFARANQCNYVLFDRDADTVDELPVWEW